MQSSNFHTCIMFKELLTVYKMEASFIDCFKYQHVTFILNFSLISRIKKIRDVRKRQICALLTTYEYIDCKRKRKTKTSKNNYEK
jgi:hypothetical protein